MIVVDASVVIKWVVDENDEATRRAIKLRERYLSGEENIICPDLLLYEIGNIFAYKTQLPSIAVTKAWQSFVLLAIPTVSATTELITDCLKFSQKYKITVYDAAYVALAELKKCSLVTADKKLVNRVNLPFVRLLGAE